MTETQKVAIVTGAAGGIGKAMTLGLLAAGVRVASVDRDREPLEALAASVREQSKGAELLTIQTDWPTTPRSTRSPTPPAPGSAASTSSSTPPGSAQVPSALTVGSTLQILGHHAGSVASLRRGPHDRTVGAGERCRARDDARAGVGSSMSRRAWARC
jgi:NAD(P)-dependent dehydrogenase (short-subunit alcohol dehydrogenase family)